MPSAQRVVERNGHLPAPGADVSEEESFMKQPLVAAPPGNALAAPGQRAQTPQQRQLTKKKPYFTPVDGRGMWANWMRSFKTPILACFDLLDNAFDAAMGAGGRVDIARLDTGGIVIINNSHSAVKAIEEVCKIYKSEKGKSHSTIGENGVGLKQGCAALADVSLVLVKNAKVQLTNANGDDSDEDRTVLSLAIIARCLQEEAGCRVPSFSFMIDDDEDTPQLSRDIMQELNYISQDDPDAAACIHTFGIHRLADLFVSILSNSWKHEPHIFCLALTDLKHGSERSGSDEDSSSDDETSVNDNNQGKTKRHNTRKIKPSTSLLQDLARVLPINYIHVPRDVTVRIDEKPIRFSYWPRRLVELSKFTVHVDKTRNLHEYKNSDTSWQTTGYPLTIYAGFDCLRLGERQLGANSACRLYIYSRQCGRLITLVNDARHLLKLSSGGTDFAQGLTIIVDDSAGHLPLTPSKQDIAFSEERGAAAHEGNFYAWIGAVAKMFWHFHADKFGSSNKKTLLSAAVEEHREAIEAELLAENTFIMSLETAALTRFDNVPWTKRTMGTTEDTITKVSFNKRPKGGPTPPESFYIPGVATKFKFESNPARIHAKFAAAAALKSARKPKQKKRRRISQISESKTEGPSDILNGHASPRRKDNRLKAQLMSSVMDSDFESGDDDNYSFVDDPRTQEVTSSSNEYITEEPMSPHQNGLQERLGQVLTQVEEERSKVAKLEQELADASQYLTQAKEETAKVGILEEKVKELSQEASLARAEAQQAKKEEDQALTKLCRTVVEKDNLIDELRRKVTEKDRLILTLQETDTLEL